MSPLLLDHLWQSTIVLAVIGLLTLFFRNNGAHVRHALWTAASVKFLVPFALLNGLGHSLSTLLTAPLVQPPMVQAVYGASQPFSDGPVFVALPAPGTWLLPATLAWTLGMLAVAAFWLSRWLKLRAALRAARDADIAAPMKVKMSSTLLEPGLIGIVRSVLLLPEGIAEKLSSAELNAILAHEACHMRRRDNLTAALHMLVEAIFWFWPPVWWLGTRLIAEREKACDEAVVASGNDPLVYAESILKVCKHYVSSPFACAAGISGADLKQRMEDIMRNNVIARLSLTRKALLAAAAAAALVLPLAAGVFTAPPALAQSGRASLLSPLVRISTSKAPTPVQLVSPPRRTSGRSAPVTRPAVAPPRLIPASSVQTPAPLLPPSAAPSETVLMPPSSATAQLNAPQAAIRSVSCRLMPMVRRVPPYPALLRRLGEDGTVEMRVTVAPEGAPEDIVVTRSSGWKSLDAAAQAEVMSMWRWQSRQGCGPEQARVRVRYTLLDAH